MSYLPLCNPAIIGVRATTPLASTTYRRQTDTHRPRCIDHRPSVPPFPLTLFRILSTHSLSDLSTMTKSSFPIPTVPTEPVLIGTPRLLETKLDDVCCLRGLSWRWAVNSLLGVEARGDGLGELRYRTAFGSFTGVSVEWYARVWFMSGWSCVRCRGACGNIRWVMTLLWMSS